MEIFKKISQIFWSESFWLPPNTTWDDVGPISKFHQQHTKYQDILIHPIKVAAFLIILRYVFEKYLFSPIGKKFGVENKKIKPTFKNRELEVFYLKNKSLNKSQLTTLSKEFSMSERQIQRWWRRRKAQNRPTALEKFCECAWRCSYYSFIFGFGLCVLWNKQWLWNIKHCWYGYPHQALDDGVWWYYMISMGFYLSLLFSQFYDAKRKDFWQMFIHHIATIFLMVLSWYSNFHRVGSLVLIVHDFSDIFLDGAKALKYIKMIAAGTVMFVIFTISWLVARIGLFPRIIYSSVVERLEIVGTISTVQKVLIGLLVLLLILHVMWTIFLLEAIRKAVIQKNELKDSRSCSESFDSSSDIQILVKDP